MKGSPKKHPKNKPRRNIVANTGSGSSSACSSPSRCRPSTQPSSRPRSNSSPTISVSLSSPPTSLPTSLSTPPTASTNHHLPSTDEIKQLNWIITAFNLTSAAFLPIFAQLADVFGRHATLQAALVVITVGSALCTASPTSAFPLLLFGRALQGVGAAGINICVRTILADRVSLGEYAKNWTTFALVSGISFGLGPVAGGYLTKISWRWCFAINLPVAVVGIGLVLVLLRGRLIPAMAIEDVTGGGWGVQEGQGYRPRRRDPGTPTGRFLARLATIDFGGQLLFLLGLGLLVLGFTWAGSTYAWDSPAVLVTLVVGAVLTVAWLVYEWAMVPGRVMSRVFPMQTAMMPWQLLMQKDVGLMMGINFANGAAMFAIMYYMDLYFTLVLGHSASDAGIALLYFLPGLGGTLSPDFPTGRFILTPRQPVYIPPCSSSTSGPGKPSPSCSSGPSAPPSVSLWYPGLAIPTPSTSSTA